MVNVGKVAAAEGIVTQNISVFKRNLKQLVVTFDNKFNATNTEEEKVELLNLALHYMNGIDKVFTAEPSTASNIFTVITSKLVRPDLLIFRNILVTNLKQRGLVEDARGVADLINEIINEVGGNVKAFTTAPEEAEESTPTNTSISMIDKILGEFNRDIATGDIPDYV